MRRNRSPLGKSRWSVVPPGPFDIIDGRIDIGTALAAEFRCSYVFRQGMLTSKLFTGRLLVFDFYYQSRLFSRDRKQSSYRFRINTQ